MSVELASVVGMLGSLGFLYWWQAGLTNANVFSVGLKYLIRGLSLGLLLPVTGYIINIQTDAALSSIVTIPNTVYLWTWWLVLVFLALNFTFDVLRMRKVT